MRINSSLRLEINLHHLQDSKNWLQIVEYTFDDIWPDMTINPGQKYVMFDRELAERILKEFEQYNPQTESLLVHCSRD